jgi:DnaJ family protein A protein 2
MSEKDRCKKCKGQRVVDQEKTIEVPLEKGVPDEHDYVFYGESDEIPGVMAGDLYIRIKIKKHKIFERRGADLMMSKRIQLVEALSGVHFQ